MMNCESCKEWKRYARKLERTIEKLKEERNEYWNKAEKAENTIERELEPRIAKEKRGYDVAAISGFGDICHKSGMSGLCDPDCEGYDEDECNL